MKIAEYILSFDDEFAEDGEYLGVMEIANTANPAIQIKGVAFSSNKKLLFKDDKKHRIAAPVLMPSRIFRRDPETKEEYYLTITEEAVNKAFQKFQRDRAGEVVFNYEHDESKKVPSYMLETWMVEDPKTDKSLSVYGIEVPKGTWFGVQQFTDVDTYNEFVKDDITGFSIHGEGAMRLQLKNHNMNKLELKEEETVTVNGVEFHFKDNKLIPVELEEEEVELAEEEVELKEEVVEEEKVEEVEAEAETIEAEEVVEEEVIEAEAEEEEEVAEIDEAAVMKILQPKLDEIYDMIADLKVDKEEVVEEVEEEVELSGRDVRMSKVNRLKEVFKN